MAGMTKEDRAEYETRLASVGYWRKLSHENALNYGLTSKREFLATERAKEAQSTAIETKEETPMQPATQPHEFATHWQRAIARFVETFGTEIIAEYMKCPSRDRFAFAQSVFPSNPLAACVLYAIEESAINANDTHGNAFASKAWDDCFGATLSMYLDDWTMIEYSGLARLNHDVWPMIGNQIHAYDRGLSVQEQTLATIELSFWETETALALDIFRDEPESYWKKADLLEIAEKRDLAFKRWVQDAFSKANDVKIEPHNPVKGNLGLDATFDCMMSKAIANGTYADIAFDETKGKVLSLLSDNETAVVLKRVSGIWEEMDRFQRETYFKGGHWSDCDISRAIYGGF